MQPPPVPSKDAEHLRTLSICHYVVAGLSLFGIAFLALHYAIMSTVFGNPKLWEKAKEPPPFDPVQFFHLMQWFYLLIGLFILACGIVTLMSGRFLGKRVNRTFSLIIAGLNCLFVPFGTILGVFTLVVLTKESVIRLYEESSPPS